MQKAVWRRFPAGTDRRQLMSTMKSMRTQAALLIVPETMIRDDLDQMLVGYRIELFVKDPYEDYGVKRLRNTEFTRVSPDPAADTFPALDYIHSDTDADTAQHLQAFFSDGGTHLTQYFQGALPVLRSQITYYFTGVMPAAAATTVPPGRSHPSLMRAPLYQVDAFAARRFTGNPAAVVLLQVFPEDAVMAGRRHGEQPGGDRLPGEGRRRLPVALVHAQSGGAALRPWHARQRRGGAGKTGAEARPSGCSTPRAARSRLKRRGQGYVMDFPARPAEQCPAPQGLAGALGAEVKETWVNVFNYMAVLESAEQVRALIPDIAAVQRIDRPGIIVTAPGDQGYDCVSRYFAPQKGIPEDPVTAPPTACSHRTGASGCTRPSYAPSRPRRAAAKCAATWWVSALNSRAVASSIWKARRRYNLLFGMPRSFCFRQRNHRPLYIRTASQPDTRHSGRSAGSMCILSCVLMRHLQR